jgi:uncharacterized CHY-type Zn-finger protein
MKCCGHYYACRDCHAALADHPGAVWAAAEWDQRAVRCGACGAELTIREYLACGAECPACRAPFNPRCAQHYDSYFEMGTPSTAAAHRPAR